VSDWQTLVLEKALTFQRGFDITKAQQQDGPYPVFSSSGAKSSHATFKVRGPGVIIGRKGSLGTVFYSEGDFWPHDTTLWVKNFHGNSPGFAYYFIQTMGFERLDAGASNPTLNRNHIHTIPVKWPSLSIQRKITSILSVYDNLIENNTRRITILEEIAQMIYREWFVNYHFPGHENVKMVDSPLGKIPEGWEIENLSSLVKTQYGYTESASKTEVGPKYIRGMDINKTSYIQWESVPYCPISEQDYKKYKLSRGDILVIRMADPGKVGIIEKDINSVFASYLIRLHLVSSKVTTYYLFSFLLSDHYQNFVSGASTGTTRKSASAGVLTNIDLLVPKKEVLDKFENVVFLIRGLLNNLLEKNMTLRETRDLLLPKLISGDVDVSDLDIEIPEIEEEELSILEEISKPEFSPLQKKISNPVIKKKSKAVTLYEDSEESIPIEEYETDEIMAAFRQVGRSLGITDRDTLLKEVSVDLGYQRLGPKILEILTGHLRSAIRRKIIGAKGQEVWLETPTMAKYYRKEIVQTLCSVMKTGKEYEREDVMYAVANHLGFRKLPEPVRKPIKSAINSAIRQGIVESNGSSIWRVK